MLIATTNPGKVREIRLALGRAAGPLVTLADLTPIAEPEETGRTFAENAAQKARYYARLSGMPTVAEDSGLEIDALGGRPGVESARYPGDTYAEKFAGLYRELAETGAPRPWTARFVCALAYVAEPGLVVSSGRADEGDGPLAHGGADSAGALAHSGADPAGSLAHHAADSLVPALAFTCEGVVEGEISPEPRGRFGFGYDPIFICSADGWTTGEMTDAEKLTISHRGAAFRQFRAWLEREKR